MTDDLDIAQPSETAYYRTLVRQYDKQAEEWHRRGKKIVERYIDKRPDGQSARLKYNILWSNVENLKPAIYAQTPKPEVERRFLDKDPVGRCASDALERTISYFLHTTPFGSVMRQVRLDYLLVGRGVSWVRYVPTIRPVEAAEISDDATTGEAAQGGEPIEQLAYEEVRSDYVHWKDFGHNVGRTWEEVFCVWRIVYMTRAQMRNRKFKFAEGVPLDYVDRDVEKMPDAQGRKATIYEIWDKDNRKVYWMAKSWNQFLDERDDPLGLDKFFPCSEPMYATLSNDSLIPVPDFAEYQDQAAELDDLTNRIGLMQKAVKAAGVYDASQKELGRLLSEGVENKLIPVDSWAAMAEKGGLKNSIELLPMQEIAQTLMILYETREKVLADLYQITGLSDLIRGDTHASETATAQKIKNNFISLRLSEKQREMQRLARNTIEIMGNIIARHFTLDTIKRISGLQLMTEEEKQALRLRQQSLPSIAGQIAPAQPGAAGQSPMPSAQQAVPQSPPSSPLSQGATQAGIGALSPQIQEMLDQPTWEQVYALLQDNPDRSFRIDIETDSTIEADQQQDQQAATEFVTAIGGFLQQAEQAAGNPDIAMFLGEMLSWACRRWPISRDLQSAIDTLTEKLAKAAKNPPPPKPDPAMAKVQGDQQVAQAKLQGDQQVAQAKLQGDQQIAAQKAQSDAQIEQMRMQAEAQAEQRRQEHEAQMEAMRAHMEDQREQSRMAMDNHAKAAQAMIADAFNRWKAEKDNETKIEVAEIAADATLEVAQKTAAKQAASE